MRGSWSCFRTREDATFHLLFWTTAFANKIKCCFAGRRIFFVLKRFLSVYRVTVNKIFLQNFVTCFAWLVWTQAVSHLGDFPVTVAILVILHKAVGMWCEEQPRWSCFPMLQLALQLYHPLLKVLWCINIPTTKKLNPTRELITLEVTSKICQRFPPGDPFGGAVVPRGCCWELLHWWGGERSERIFTGTSLRAALVPGSSNIRAAGDEIQTTSCSCVKVWALLSP